MEHQQHLQILRKHNTAAVPGGVVALSSPISAGAVVDLIIVGSPPQLLARYVRVLTYTASVGRRADVVSGGWAAQGRESKGHGGKQRKCHDRVDELHGFVVLLLAVNLVCLKR